jgi:hypothetical protein
LQEKHFSFIVIGRIIYGADKTGRQVHSNISIYCLTTKDLTAIIYIISESLRDRTFVGRWCYHAHSSILLKAFNGIKKELNNNKGELINSQLCLIAQSGSRVYKLVLGDSAKVDSMVHPTFASKISSDISRYTNEITALKAITNYCHVSSKEHYAIAYYDLESSEIKLFVSPKDPPIPELSLKLSDADMDQPWFSGFFPIPIPAPTHQFGAVVMHEGVPMWVKPYTFGIYCELRSSLTDIHGAGIVHRDLRSLNFMHFPK